MAMNAISALQGHALLLWLILLLAAAGIVLNTCCQAITHSLYQMHNVRQAGTIA